ncbi:Plant invertase/pectin methylesterase inhibitor superfamily protein [Raphanus sativus]|uniref:Pectinesterase inhibitor 11-like n=1 Tax=Raphanus sativus TaxID=3726 RepID=A0A6J0LRF4_RAPSA|nr:pectinesterase inhibitor 11-like [Raphanus sativus]KAJ4887745.1 Plant invertase/pectin methylesterase inhibitor superfamily protein [Raphanus sativus]
MAKHYKVFFLVLSISYLFSGELTAAATETTTTTEKALSFIISSCKTTTYRSLCVHSLSTYANTIQTNPQRLVKTALSVTMKHAQSTKLLVSHLKNSQFRTLQDCAPSPDVYNTDRLTEAILELKRSDSESVHSQFLFHVSKAQALFISASDDWEVENTCSGSFLSTTKSVQARLVNLRKETSNVMSLFNAFAKE